MLKALAPACAPRLAPWTSAFVVGQAATRLISTLSHYCEGDLDRVDQVIKVTGIVNGVPDFREHGKVVDGAISHATVFLLPER